MSIETARSIAKHFGITVSTEDAPKIIKAIQNAYAAGRADEREACASICEEYDRRFDIPEVRWCAQDIRARSST